MKVSTWFLPPNHPTRMAEEARQLALILELEKAARLAGLNIRPKVPA